MVGSRTTSWVFLLSFTGMLLQPAFAETPVEVLDTAGFQEFSATRGKAFYESKHGSDWSCSTCHTDNPAAQGKHAKTEKPIKPIAPSANPERFTDMKKVEKWFKRNCNDVLDRVCTPQEKGDFLTYLLTINK
jgi:hypothetical protein